jgi:hypothetical protein
MLFNHVMRCYWFGELFAQQQNVKADSELVFLSAALDNWTPVRLSRPGASN